MRISAATSVTATCTPVAVIALAAKVTSLLVSSAGWSKLNAVSAVSLAAAAR